MFRAHFFGPRCGRAARAVLLVALALVAAAIFLLRSNSAPRQTPAAPPASVAAPLPSDHTPVTPAVAAAVSERASVVDDESNEAVPKAVEVEGDDDRDRVWFDVHCIRAHDGAPAPGIAVYAVPVDSAFGWNLMLSRAAGTELETFLRTVVDPVVTDASGRARVAAVLDRAMFVVASGSGLWGHAQLERLVRRVTIELTAELPLEVFVADADGAGVPGVVVSARVVQRLAARELATALTGADGRAKLKLSAKTPTQYPAGSLFVGVNGLFPEPLQVPLDFDAGEVRLQLPPHGWVKLSLEDALENQPALRLALQASEAGTPSATWGGELEGLAGPDAARVFGPVALGAHLIATGSALGAASRSASTWRAEDMGPALQGETVTVILRRNGALRLRGRALDFENQPIAKATLTARLFSRKDIPTGTGPGEELRTDAEGAFPWDLPPDTVPGSIALLTVKWRGTEHFAEFAVPADDPAGTDLGDVLFREVPLAVHGRVLDPGGTPILGAAVHLSGSSQDLFLATLAKTQSGADGRFAVRTRSPDGNLQVEISAPGFVAFQRSFVGPLDLGDVRLARAAGVSGRVLFGSLDNGGALDVVADNGSGQRHRALLDPSGDFAIEEMGSGVWQVSLGGNTLLGGDVPLWSDVEFRAEEGALDLGTTDLAGRIRRTELLVRTGEGALVSELYLSRASSEVNVFRQKSSGSKPDGVHVVWHPAELTAARVSADGCRAAHVALLGTRQELTLQPALEVVLRVQGADQLPANVELSAHVMRPGLDPTSLVEEVSDGRATVFLSEVGTYGVRFQVFRTDAVWRLILPDVAHASFTPIESTGPQEFVLQLPPEVLADARRLAEGQ